jgi:transposase
MPWEQSSPMDQKTQFVSEYLRDTISFTEFCDRCSISRKTGYKCIDRYQADGPAGLADRSRRPRSSPDETSEPLG